MSITSLGKSSSSVILPPLSLDQEQALRVQAVASRAVISRETLPSFYLSQYDRLVGQVARELVNGKSADKKLMHFQPNPKQSFHLTGSEIKSLLLQLRDAIPDIASIPAERRKNHRFPVIMPTGERVTVLAGNIPDYLIEMQKLLQPAEEEPGFEKVSVAVVQEISSREKSARKAFVDQLSSWIFDPGNPEKEKKYIYSLYSIRKALDVQFPRWKTVFLPQLGELASHSSFAKHAYFALNALKENAESENEIRAQYAFILSNIREAYSLIPPGHFDTPQLNQAAQMLLQFCHCKFTKVHMYPFLNDFIPKVLRAPQGPGNIPYELPKFTWQNLSENIRAANERLTKAPPEYRQTLLAKELKKIRGAIGWGFDPVGDSNTPWVHSIQEAKTPGGPRTCTVLRHGTPTRDPGFLGTVTRIVQNALRFTPAQQATVIAEYKAYLAAKPEKVTLYVNHQEFDGTRQHWVTAERDRTRALQSLEKDFPNFNFLALPMDGPLWEKSYLEKTDMKQLKQHLFQSLLNGSNGFAFPRDLMKDAARQAGVERLLNDVHDLYFRVEELNPEAKQAFIILFYSELKDYLINTLRVDYIASVCKDHKERSNVSTTIDMAKNLVKLGLENDPERLYELFISVLGPFVIKNEHILHTRLELGLNVLRHLAGLSEAQKKRIRETDTTGYQVVKQTVPKEETSWAQMVGGKKFFAFIENMKELGEKRVALDWDFQKNLASTYLRDGRWNLAALRLQIEKDMPRTVIMLNGRRMVDFEVMRKELGLSSLNFDTNPKDEALSIEQKRALRFLSMMQQGASAEVMRDPSHYLNGNGADYLVADTVLSPSRKTVQNIIAQARVDKAGALELARGAEKDREVGSYLSSAIASGFLSEEFRSSANQEEFHQPVYSTRIRANYDCGSGKRDLIVEQELQLRHPVGGGASYPISAMACLEDEQPAKLSWHFTFLDPQRVF